MMQSVVIPVGLVDEDTLLETVDGLKKITQADIKIETQYVLTSSYPAVIDGLKSLISERQAQGNGNGSKPNGKKPNGKTRKPLTKQPKSAAGGWKTYTIIGATGLEDPKKYTKGEISAMLRQGKFEPGSTVRHPRQGLMKISGLPEIGQFLDKNTEA